MKKYPIRQLIDSGSWFHCETKPFLSQVAAFNIRFKSFRSVDSEEIDNPERITAFNLNEGCLWLLGYSVVNKGKEGFAPHDIHSSFVIVDEDDCIFPSVIDSHLSSRDFAYRTGLYRSTHGGNLLPKMVTGGVTLFFLPESESPRHFLALKKDGIMEEL